MINLQLSERQHLQTSWGKQLYRDYQSICYHYRLTLDQAVLVVGEFAKPIARWDAPTRRIEVSFAFIYSHPWHLVLEVLKHEMAHQIVDEVFRQSCVHGPWFKKAGAMLGLQSWALGACLDLESLSLRGGETTMSSEQQRLLARAQKLLALAASANQWEAGLAMQKVHELYDSAYLASLQEEQTKSAYVSIMIEQRQKRIATYQSMIASLLVRYFHVQVIHSSCYHAHDQVEYKTLELLGLAHQVEMAEYVYHFLDKRTKSLWQEYRRQPSAPKGLRPSSFYQGVIAGFGEKLKEQQLRAPTPASDDLPGSEMIPSEKALMLRREKQRLREFVDYRHPRLRTVRVGSSAGSKQLFVAGKVRGQQVVLHRPLKQGSSSPRLFLGPSKQR